MKPRLFIDRMTAIYRISLLLLPKSFRREYERELMLAFIAMIEDAYQRHGWRSGLFATLSSIGDVVRGAVREHWQELLLKLTKGRAALQCTPRVEAAMQFAHQEAVQERWCSDEHILLGLVREGGGLAAMVLHKLGVTAESLRRSIVRTETDSQSDLDRKPTILALAQVEASNLGHAFVGTEHLLLGLLSDGGQLPETTFQCSGLSLHQARQTTLTTLAELEATQPSIAGRYFITALQATKALAAAILLLALAGMATKALGEPTSPREQEVQVSLGGGQRVDAWLMLPKSPKPVPAIVMIPGYSPARRNEGAEAPRKPDQDNSTTLAQYLTQQGFAVLRLPIGGSGNELAIDELSDRAIECTEYLRSRPEIDSQQIGMLGQSVGGLVATHAASRTEKLAFVVTLATPMESIDRTYIGVLDKLLLDNGASPEQRALLVGKLECAFATAAKGASADELRPQVEDFLRAQFAWLNKQQRQMSGDDVDKFVDGVLVEHVNNLTSPMFRSLIGYDASEALVKIQCPALILFAEHDRKVNPIQSSVAAKGALERTGRADWVVEVIDGADHLFEAPRGGVDAAEHGPEQRFSQDFLETFTPWIRKYVSLPTGQPAPRHSP